LKRKQEKGKQRQTKLKAKATLGFI
jgi:hypothetical protein